MFGDKKFDIWDCEKCVTLGGDYPESPKIALYENDWARAFLPQGDPIVRLDSSLDDFWGELETLASEMPMLLENRKWRSEVVARLRPFKEHLTLYHVNQLDQYLGDSGHRLERAMLLYSYFASAYVHATYENSSNHIPKEIAVPLVELAKKVSRPPILAYASYCLTNWKNSPLLGESELLQNFTPTHKADEDWFILVHVDIEYKFQPALFNIYHSRGYMQTENIPGVHHCLSVIYDSLQQMNVTMDRMPEKCNPDFYFNRVRPYIFGFQDVIYEGCFENQPQSFRGETGAQSSIIPLLVRFLSINHKDSKLTKHLDDMKKYMPLQHRDLLDEWTGYNNACAWGKENKRDWSFPCTSRQFAEKHTQLKDIYNHCLEELLKFRSRHLEYAVNYIQKKVENPKGTGGTPFIPWLSQLKEETEAHFL